MKTLYTLCDCLSYYGLTTITDAKRWRNTKSLITKLHKEFQCCVHREEIPPSTFTATLFPNQLEQRPDKYEEKNSARAKLTISPTFFRCALPVDLKPINDWQSKIVPPRATKKNRVFFRYTKILNPSILIWNCNPARIFPPTNCNNCVFKISTFSMMTWWWNASVFSNHILHASIQLWLLLGVLSARYKCEEKTNEKQT